MAQILVVRPGSLTAADRKKLRAVDVVCVEADDPASVRLIGPEGAPMAGSDMLFAALSAMAAHPYSTQNEAFVKLLAKLMGEARASLGQP